MTRKERTINMALWVALGSLAAALLFSGLMKLSQPATDIAAIWPWTKQHAHWIKSVGAIEILLGLTILLPELLRTTLKIRRLAAYTVMSWILIYSIALVRATDLLTVGANFMYFLLATFIAWGRSKKRYNTPS